MLTSVAPIDAASSPLAVAERAAALLLEGAVAEARALLERAPEASALVHERALAIARAHAQRGDCVAFRAAAERIVELLFGADAERTADTLATLAEDALALGDTALCARLVSRAAPAAHVLAIRVDRARLARLERVADAAVVRTRAFA